MPISGPGESPDRRPPVTGGPNESRFRPAAMTGPPTGRASFARDPLHPFGWARTRPRARQFECGRRRPPRCPGPPGSKPGCENSAAPTSAAPSARQPGGIAPEPDVGVDSAGPLAPLVGPERGLAPPPGTPRHGPGSGPAIPRGTRTARTHTPTPPAFTDGDGGPGHFRTLSRRTTGPGFAPGVLVARPATAAWLSPPGLIPVGRPVGTAWRSDVDAAGDPVTGVPLFGGRSPTERALPRPVRSRVRRRCCRRRPGWGCPTKGGGCPPAEAISRLRLNRAAGRTPCTRRGGVTPRTVFPRESPPRDGPTEPSQRRRGLFPPVHGPGPTYPPLSADFSPGWCTPPVGSGPVRPRRSLPLVAASGRWLVGPGRQREVRGLPVVSSAPPACRPVRPSPRDLPAARTRKTRPASTRSHAAQPGEGRGTQARKADRSGTARLRPE